MNENITNDLRQSAQWINEMEHESWFGTAELQLEAADKIERLRAENERLRAAGDALAATWPEEERCRCNNPDCRAVVAAYDAWKEARRG